MRRPKLFGSHLTPSHRRVYGGVLVFYLFAFAAMVWPLMKLFNHARPLILGMPASLFYVACLVMSSFLVQLALYLWEQKHGPGPPEDDS